MPDANTTVAESSPAAVETPTPSTPSKASQIIVVPRIGPEREAFFRDGKMPDEKKPSKPEPKTEEAKPKADSTPAKDPDTVPPAEGGKTKQEVKAAKPPTDAEARLNELIGDLKRAGLTPKELKTFKREQQQQAAPASEPTPPPSKAAEAPKPPSFDKPEPQLKDFDDVEKFAKAHGKWMIDNYEFERNQREQQAKLDADVKQMRKQAAERYGPDYEVPLKHAAEQIFTKDGGAVPAVIKQMFNDSDVLPDLLYTLGTKAEDLNSFVSLAKNDPGKAIRKLVIMENLIREELAKGKADAKSSNETEGEEKPGVPGRGEDGKFVKADTPAPEAPKPPARKVTQTLPPPMEAGGLKPAPPDDLAAVIERINAGTATPADTQRFMRLENEREIARRRGR